MYEVFVLVSFRLFSHLSNGQVIFSSISRFFEFLTFLPCSLSVPTGMNHFKNSRN